MTSPEQQNYPLWFKHAVIYQLHVKSFYDKNQDGIGDFAGLTEKLDYLESLGITAIWLLPFFPSPLKDDGYDISDYFDVHPNYGTLKDFRRFLREAHSRGLKIITELVINHTSDQHPWFERARRAKPGSSYRDFYVWSDTPERYKEARIIFKDFESSNWAWDPVAKAYYWHRFYSHQPDLNFDNPAVKKEIFRTLAFWFEMGVDGLRLDAIPYLFKREGTNCENLPETHAFIKELRKHIDKKFKDKILIAEANQWPEDAAAYFGNGDECHMAFHFPAMPRIFMAIQMEDRFPILDILEQTPAPPASCQWAIFLRNHDELTLEMVSDEERDYMYRIYAKDPKARINLGIRRRLAPLLENDRSRIELINVLLFSLPGTPVIYYGDEIGMGDNYYLGDRNGVRTPMQWSADRNAGFSRSNPQQLYLPIIIDPAYHYEAVNVDNQERNPSSLLWWFRRILLLYKNHKAFGLGTFELISSDNPKTLCFIRSFEDEILLVLVNLSRFSQATNLDLTKFIGYTPRELFHQNQFPTIKESKYSVTLGAHDYFLLSLTRDSLLTDLARVQEDKTRSLQIQGHWKNILKEPYKQLFETHFLPKFLCNARWFERKGCTIESVKMEHALPFGKSLLSFLEVKYLEIEDIDHYLLPIAFALKQEAEQIILNSPQGVIANIHIDGQEGILYDGIYSEDFRNLLLSIVVNHKKMRFGKYELEGYYAGRLKQDREFRHLANGSLQSQVLKEEQSNSSIIYDQHFFLKLYRRLEEGVHPDIEIEKFLCENSEFNHLPEFLGEIEWHQPFSFPTSIALLEGFVVNEGTGWSFALDALSSYYERVLALSDFEKETEKIKESSSLSSDVMDTLIGGGYLEAARLLGQRTAEMHLALSLRNDDKDFAPEPFSTLYQRSIYQSMRGNVRTIFPLLKHKLANAPENLKELSEKLFESEQEILKFFQKILEHKFSGLRMRIHGDYHLGQVLYTGKDFFVIDFEGEPLLSLESRRIKRSPLRDIAGMIRSFYYATHNVLRISTTIRPEMISKLEPWADLWYQRVSAIFLNSYMQKIGQSPIPLVPKDKTECEYLLQAFILEKAIYELGYELNTRPDWASIPIKGIIYTLEHKISWD